MVSGKLTQLSTEIIDRLTNKFDNNKIIFNLYIDLSKAFDILNHIIVLSKLHHYGMRNTAVTLLKSYFEKNTVTTKVFVPIPQG